MEENQTPKPKKPLNLIRWFALGLGGAIGISYIGVVGTLVNKNTESKFPSLPVGPYTSYQIESNEYGYRIAYKANDPKILYSTKDIEKSGGFLGNKKERINTTEMFTMDGALHHGGPVSSRSAWIDPSALGKGEDKTSLSEKTIACIEASGSGRGTGTIVGSSIAAGTVAPALANIPFIGWVAAGFATMFGADKGGDIGAELATTYADCD